MVPGVGIEPTQLNAGVLQTLELANAQPREKMATYARIELAPLRRQRNTLPLS